MLYRVFDVCDPTGLGPGADAALIEERYWSRRRQVPVIYLLGFINLSAMELAATGRLSLGLNCRPSSRPVGSFDCINGSARAAGAASTRTG